MTKLSFYNHFMLMLFAKSIFCFIIFMKLSANAEDNANTIYSGGGYLAKLCFPYENNKIEAIGYPKGNFLFTCSKVEKRCSNGSFFMCNLTCSFKQDKNVKRISIQNKMSHLKIIPSNLSFHIERKDIDYGDNRINITLLKGSLLLQPGDIRITFLGEFNESCSNTSIVKNSIICKLKITRKINYKTVRTNVTLSYGNKTCEVSHSLGEINIKSKTKNLKQYIFILGISISSLTLLLLLIAIIIMKKRQNKSINTIINSHSTELMTVKNEIINIQKRAFLEYQTAVSSFPDLGSLTPMHILSFYNYVSRVFNINLPIESSIYKNYKSEKFRAFILNKVKLIKWIDRVEKECKLQQRSLIASLLTIVLFQHPEYFLEIIKCLLVKYIKKLKETNEEKFLFCRSEAIVEKIIGNWITLCMYRNLKTGEVGKKFFNLYRAIKCKMNEGLVDCITNKAKYALTFDYIMLRDIDYDILNIKASVEVNLKMMNNVSGPLRILLHNIDVQVLSLDSISQVKEKILDKAIMLYSEKETIDNSPENRDLCLGLNYVNDFKLQLINNTTKIMLDDFDQTSIRSETENDCLMMNTMKHYNLKTGTRFLLNSIEIVGNILPIEQNSILNQKLTKVHLQLPSDYRTADVVTELQKQHPREVQSKKTFSPVVEDINKEAYLMRLLATKQSLIVFIEGFFQSIFNWNPKQINNTSSNSLFISEKRSLLLDSMNLDPQSLLSKEMYLSPIFFLFSMLDDIAYSLGITDTTAISLWKSNSFFLRFWVNMITNPNFIFSVDKSGAIGGCLTTVASVLMESCSMSSSNTLNDMNLPIVKQLFLKELKEYSSWWRYFTESATHVDNSVIVTQMKDIFDTYSMISQYNSSLTSLEAIANNLISELSKLEENS